MPSLSVVLGHPVVYAKPVGRAALLRVLQNDAEEPRLTVEQARRRIPPMQHDRPPTTPAGMQHNTVTSSPALTQP